jgi:hypothetical protein
MTSPDAHGVKRIAFLLLCCSAWFALTARGGERLIIQLKDFTETEVKCGGFTLSQEMPVHISAIGGGEANLPFSNDGMYAYGWIINADTRKPVWKMTRDNTRKDKSDRRFDDNVTLRRGSYEVYFAAYGYASKNAFSNFNINIDRRKGDADMNRSGKGSFLDWLRELIGEDAPKEWKQRARNWGIDVAVNDGSALTPMFSPPKEFPHQLFQARRLGENEYVHQRFTLARPMTIRIYALGEKDFGESFADYGWIVDVKTRRRVWEMERSNVHAAGGADKNVQYDESVEFPAGDFTLYYVTDGSHSFVDWNAPPPDDPLNYGITLIAQNPSDKEQFKLSSGTKEEQNVIVQLTKVGNDETRSANFTLKADATVRIYAMGEKSNSRRQMADFGWIINARTREKVWTMDADRTEHAGGADKNCLIDELLPLAKGSYTVFYQTDDSHAYNDWNSSPPFDPEHWGITIYGEGAGFTMSMVERNADVTEAGVLAQITRAGNGANLTKTFSLDKTTHLRVYAIGEGQNRTMYDYGWIEDAGTGKVVWEMTYAMTFHAGGGRKNRMVTTKIILDRGTYILHYVSDDSHSFGQWNVDPPDDPTMWGITLYKEE